jgi:hypothetical protein
MFVVAQHTIKDAKHFWETAKNNMNTLPSHLKLHQVLPNKDGSKAVCLWSASNIEDVKKYVEEQLGKYSSNLYFPVEATNAIGLPK